MTPMRYRRNLSGSTTSRVYVSKVRVSLDNDDIGIAREIAGTCNVRIREIAATIVVFCCLPVPGPA